LLRISKADRKGDLEVPLVERLKVIAAAMKWEQIKHNIKPEEEEPGSSLLGGK